MANKQAILNAIETRVSEQLTGQELQNFLEWIDLRLNDPVETDVAKRISLILSTSGDPVTDLRLLFGEGKQPKGPQWVSATIGSLSGLPDLLEDWNSLLESISDAVAGIEDALKGAVTAVEAQKAAIQARSNAIEGALKGAVGAVEEALNDTSEAIRRITNKGIWLLPQFEALDIPLFIRKEILGIAGLDAEIIERERLIRVADDKFVRVKPKYYRRPRYETFVEDVVDSFADPNDHFRPPDGKITGVSMVVAADDVVTFIVTLAIVYLFIYGPERFRQVGDRFIGMIRGAINIAEERGRLATKQDLKVRLNTLADRFESFLESELNSYTAILSWFKDTITLVSGSPKASGEPYQINYSRLSAEAFYTPDQSSVSLTSLATNQIATYSTSVSGSAVVLIKVNGEEYGRYLVENGELKIKLPIFVSGPLVDDLTTVDGQPANSVDISNPEQPLINGFAFVPTKYEIEFYQPEAGQDIQIADWATPVETHTWYALRFKQLFGNTQADRGDAFRFNQTLEINVRANRLVVERDSGGDFTAATRSNYIDLTQFGEGLSLVDVTINAYLPFVVSSAIEVDLLWDGKVYKPYVVDGNQTHIIARFKGLPVPDNSFKAVTLIRDAERNSEPFLVEVERAAGKLGPVKILSGPEAYLEENILDAVERSLNRFRDVYGDAGLKTTQTMARTAVYELVVQKRIDTHLYAIIDGKPQFLAFKGSPLVSTKLYLPWNGDSASWSVSLFQTPRDSDIEAIRQSKTEVELLNRIGSHASQEATITVTASAATAKAASQPPDWLAFSLNSIIDINYIADQFSTTILNALKANLPTDPLGDLSVVADLIIAKIEGILGVVREVRDTINDLRAFFEIGGSGFWFLLLEADSLEEFKIKLKEVVAPPELANARFVAGVQLLAVDPGNPLQILFGSE